MNGMAVAPQPRAAEEAVEVLRNGGNAVDAAITAAFVQGIVDPLNCGMGGLGWMHIYDDASGEDVVLDFCSVAGSKAAPDMWEALIDRQGEDGLGYILKGDVNEIGYQSIGLPTGIRGLHEALTRYGTWSWDHAIAPAARLAREGYTVPRELAEEWRSRYSPGRPVAMTRFSVTPDAAAIYTRDGGPLDDGDVLRTPTTPRASSALPAWGLTTTTPARLPGGSLPTGRPTAATSPRTTSRATVRRPWRPCAAPTAATPSRISLLPRAA